MDIGIPHEKRPDENRVSLTPSGVGVLTEQGHRVYVETLAGAGSGFTDQQYAQMGAQIVYTPAEAWGRGEMVIKVGRPMPQELDNLYPGQILAGFLHLTAGKRQKVHSFQNTGATALAWEMVQTDSGDLPVLGPVSEIAGRLALQIAARLLENQSGGKGTLLSGAPGVPPAEVAIIGAGTVGIDAARALTSMGATVYILDKDLAPLRRVEANCRHIVTMVSTPHNLRKVIGFADVVIGAIQVTGARTPVVVTREMVRNMKPRSVIIDFSIDQGGCIETSRPTTLSSPTYIEEGITHYCVPNITGAVSRTTTHVFTNATVPYLFAIAEKGLDAAQIDYPELGRGIVIRDGQIRHKGLADLMTDPAESESGPESGPETKNAGGVQ